MFVTENKTYISVWPHGSTNAADFDLRPTAPREGFIYRNQMGFN